MLWRPSICFVASIVAVSMCSKLSMASYIGLALFVSIVRVFVSVVIVSNHYYFLIFLSLIYVKMSSFLV